MYGHRHGKDNAWITNIYTEYVGYPRRKSSHHVLTKAGPSLPYTPRRNSIRNVTPSNVFANRPKYFTTEYPSITIMPIYYKHKYMFVKVIKNRDNTLYTWHSDKLTPCCWDYLKSW